MAADPGVPLQHYLDDHPGSAVRFHCNGCQLSRDVPVADVVARLKARGLGDEQTGIRAVAWVADRPCPRCGSLAFETRPGFVVAEKGPGWRAPE